MDFTSKTHFQQPRPISVQQRATARCLQSSPAPVGALHSPEQHDEASQPPSLILFYDKNEPYYSFTNFAPDPVYFNQQRYPTSEHLFQALKVNINPIERG
jgi:hypothetical protein